MDTLIAQALPKMTAYLHLVSAVSLDRANALAGSVIPGNSVRKTHLK